MGRLRFAGPGAEPFLEHVLTNRVGDLNIGQARYSLVLNESGCVLDDILIYRMPNDFLMVVNASNREKLLAWFDAQQAGYAVERQDLTMEWGMIACQGPTAVPLVERVLGESLSTVAYYHAKITSYKGKPAVASRTGYTGEDGFELIVPPDLTETLWEELLAGGAVPVGLGARDTLRLEAGMPLYGHELSESIDPLQAKLGWAVGKEKAFLGKEGLSGRAADRPVRVGLELEGKRIAREGFEVLAGAECVGHVTSGTFAPTLERSIAMAYVRPEHAKAGSPLAVSVRGTAVSASVVALPFYRREKK
jgi:aminomethyltransferase